MSIYTISAIVLGVAFLAWATYYILGPFPWTDENLNDE